MISAADRNISMERRKRSGDRHENALAFLRQVTPILGPEHVVTEGARYSQLSLDAVCTATPPIAFVFPRTSEEVKAIMEAANRFSVAVWPYSTGKNWGYCNTANHADAVVMILNRMNRILHIDTELAYAEIEPGVTYQQLNAYLKEHNIPLWTDCTGGPPTGSVVGNALDRGVGMTPYGDHFAHLCGLEVVMPNGRVIRTGGFRDDAYGAWHTYKWGIGPSLEGLFAQSNYGIVVRAGIWLMRKPDDFVVGALKFNHGLGKSLDAVRELMFAGVLPEKARFSNDVAMFSLATQAAHEGLAGLPLTPERREALRRKYCIPAWTGSFAVYGTKAHVRQMRREVRTRLRGLGALTLGGETFARIAKRLAQWLDHFEGLSGRCLQALLRMFCGTSLTLLKLVSDLVDIHKGIPNESVVRRAYFRAASERPVKDIHVPRDGVGVLWFVPVLPFRGAEIESYVEGCQSLFDKYGFDYYVTIMILNARTAVPLMVILYDLKDDDSCRRATALYKDLVRDARSRGYQQFRCAQPGWDEIYAETPELKEVYKALKDALDPNHVLAPGRYGIR